jgi:hypothetical protein
MNHDFRVQRSEAALSCIWEVKIKFLQFTMECLQGKTVGDLVPTPWVTGWAHDTPNFPTDAFSWSGQITGRGSWDAALKAEEESS